MAILETPVLDALIPARPNVGGEGSIDPFRLEGYPAPQLSWKGGDPPMIRNLHMGTPPCRQRR
jgi:hypothetical protein